MRPMMRSMLLLLAGLLLAQQGTVQADQRAQAQLLPVHGKVFVPEGASLVQAEVVLDLEGGQQLLAFPLPDGTFDFPEVPSGAHTLSVNVRGLVFPTVRLDVGAARKGKVAAVAIDVPGTPSLPYPLLLRPFSRFEFFEKRQPFSLIGFLKTPYGMMAGFMAFSMFVLPKLKLDPEEYKEMMEERNKENAGVLTGRSSGARRSD